MFLHWLISADSTLTWETYFKMTTKKTTTKKTIRDNAQEWDVITIGFDPSVIKSCQTHASGQIQLEVRVPQVQSVTAEQQAVLQEICGNDHVMVEDVFDFIRKRFVAKVLEEAQEPLRW